MTRFIVFSGRAILLDVPLEGSPAAAIFEVKETTRLGFEVEDHDEGISYEILIGDLPLPENVQPQEHRSRLEWPASACLDGASGVTPISLRDATTGSVVARTYAMVEPSKLSAVAYERMFDDVRQISVELLLDLVSKSRVVVSRGLPVRRDSLQALTARVELTQIRRFWRGFSAVLSDIFDEPHMELRRGLAIRRLHSGERLDGSVLRGFAQRGLQARRALRTGTLLKLQTTLHSRDTLENRAIIAFIDLLRRRVERSLVRAKEERGMRVASIAIHQETDFALKRFVQLREGPKIAKLQEVIENAETLLNNMRRALRIIAVPASRMLPRDFFDGFDTPVFRSHPRYSFVAQMMRDFLRNTAIIVEQGDSEGAKSIETVYEQWVFFQICAAFRDAGLACVSHNSIFEPIARDRFSVDLDRNAAITFEAPDTRIVRLRYEPTILPHHAAQGIDSIYRGGSESPWTPDIVLEILEPRDDPRDYRLVYAAVIDAKYTTAGNTKKRLESIEKYREIRSVETGDQIARQVWVAAPVGASLQPRDEAITWSAAGDVGANPLDVILGIVGSDPGNPIGTRTTLRAFVLGTLNHADSFATAVNL